VREVKGDLFVIPDVMLGIHSQHIYTYKSNKLTNIIPDRRTPTVEIRCASPECHDWQLGENHPDFTFFPQRLAVDLLKDLKEGDTLSIVNDDKTITYKLTANQTTGYFNAFGRFEEAMNSVISFNEYLYGGDKNGRV
jgi:hypothetical protein